MRWPLRYQILVPFSAVMLGVLVGVSLLNAYLAARQTEERIEAQLRNVSDTLLGSNFPLTDAVLKQTRGLSGAEFVLTNRQGKVQASSLPSAGNLPATSTDRWERLRSEPVVSIAGTRYFHVAIPVDERGIETEPMRLHILYPEQVWREARWQAAYPPLAVGGIALSVVAVLAVFIARRMTRPIVQLQTQVGRLAEGDFAAVSVPERNDELGDLARSVNSLAEQLTELRRAIKRSERLALLGQLSGGLAHHLRNDVTGARIAVQLHKRHCSQIDPESLTVALRQLSLCEEHLKRFLAAGQPQSPQRVSCDLRRLVEELVVLVEPSCEHRKVDLQVHIPQGNAAGEGITIYADPEQLRQLLLNLVLNAMEATGTGGWVRVQAQADPRNIRLQVADSGPGPPADLVDHLFEPFTTGKPEGVGLGLAVAQQIAEAHGGSLRFDRRPYTCFELTLPLGNDGDSALAGPAEETLNKTMLEPTPFPG